MEVMTIEEIARAIDPMGGICHISSLTDEAQNYRRAATALRSQEAQIVSLTRENRELHMLVGILLEKLGGEVSLTDREIVEADQIEVQTFRTNTGSDLIVRARRLAESPVRE